MVVVDDVLDLVGRTPCVRLRKVVPSASAAVYAKLEFWNPGRSVKDRCALGILEAAEADGRLAPGSTLVEATSGNTGIALALAAAVRGYRLVVTIPRKMSQDKVRTLKALGAEVHVTPDLPHDDPGSYEALARRLAQAIPGAVFTDQCNNPANVRAHHATGREILEDFERVDAIVAGAGTGGTLSGVAEVVKAERPGVQIVGVDPAGSVLHGGTPAPYHVEGIGYDVLPGVLRTDLVDAWEVVEDAEAFLAARALARREGIFAGGSSGAALVAARRVARRLGPGHTVVVLLPDGGERYLSTFYDDAWLRERLPTPAAPPPRPLAAAAPVPGGSSP